EGATQGVTPGFQSDDARVVPRRRSPMTTNFTGRSRRRKQFGSDNCCRPAPLPAPRQGWPVPSASGASGYPFATAWSAPIGANDIVVLHLAMDGRPAYPQTACRLGHLPFAVLKRSMDALALGLAQRLLQSGYHAFRRRIKIRADASLAAG